MTIESKSEVSWHPLAKAAYEAKGLVIQQDGDLASQEIHCLWVALLVIKAYEEMRIGEKNDH